MIWWSLLTAWAADWAALRSDDGWEPVATRTIDIGTVEVHRRDVGGMWCLRAVAYTRAAPDRLMAVLWDVAAAPRWSSNPLLASEVLVPGADRMVFWQHLDVPGWTMIHDRFWILGVDAVADGDGTRGFRWTLEEVAAWPAVVARATGFDAGAMPPEVMWGEWLFAPAAAGAPGPTRVVWRGCQDIGGNVPLWLQTWAGGRSLPAAVADLVHEAERG